VTDDWFDLLAALLDAGARFLVVGAHAMAAHGVPRGTQDLDVLVDPTPDNAGRVWRALAAFGAPLDQLGLNLRDFHTPNTVVQVGLPPNRIDLMTDVSGLASFESAWQERMIVTIRGRDVPVLGRAALIANKRACGRPKDLADLHALGET
jgi:hypothetical protein